VTVYLFQTIFESQTGLPEDVFVNTLHFDCPGDISAGNVITRIQNLYKTTQSTGFAINDFLADELTGNVTTKVYNAETAPPHTPVATSSWTLNTLSASGAFPQEVAICLSYRAEPVTGVDIRSTRGRNFIGPLNVAAANGFTTGPPQNWSNPVRPRAGLTDTIAEAGGDMLDANDADGVWVVWSRVEAAGFNVVEGWCDNAFDTQRRRGVAPTTRSTFTA